jgi:aryl-alcohol dehydrogenase-like predicted oxidoreductase
VGELLDDMSPIEFVLRFTLSHPALSSTIVGTSSADHLRERGHGRKGIAPGRPV